MHRRIVAVVAIVAATLAACASASTPAPVSTPAPGEAPETGQPAVAGGQVTITTATGLSFTFETTSCSSPGTNVVNLQATGPDGDLDLRTSVQGQFSISGPTTVEGQVDTIEVADDGSVTASGTLALQDAPDVRVLFELLASPGACDRP
jgi:hypothetical protein